MRSYLYSRHMSSLSVFDHTNVTSTPSRLARGSQARSGQVSIMGREDMRSPGVKGDKILHF